MLNFRNFLFAFVISWLAVITFHLAGEELLISCCSEDYKKVSVCILHSSYVDRYKNYTFDFHFLTVRLCFCSDC